MDVFDLSPSQVVEIRERVATKYKVWIDDQEVTGALATYLSVKGKYVVNGKLNFPEALEDVYKVMGVVTHFEAFRSALRLAINGRNKNISDSRAPLPREPEARNWRMTDREAGLKTQGELLLQQ